MSANSIYTNYVSDCANAFSTSSLTEIANAMERFGNDLLQHARENIDELTIHQTDATTYDDFQMVAYHLKRILKAQTK